MRIKECQLAAIACVFAAALAGCAGTRSSKYKPNDSYVLNQPVKAADCYDA